MTITAFLALGSNLDNPRQQLISATALLDKDPHISIVGMSSLYQTPAMGPPQDDYVNAALQVTTTYSPHALLAACLAIEKEQGRIRRERWAARCIDIDILLYGDICSEETNCTLPHPGLKTRLFVLVPLYEIAPQLILPDGVAIASLLQQFTADERALIRKL